MAKKKKELEPVDVHNTIQGVALDAAKDKRVIALEIKVELLNKKIDRVVMAYNSSKKIRL